MKVLLLAGLLSACNIDKECSLVGCGPTAQAMLVDGIAGTMLTGAKVSVCHNQDCADGAVQAQGGDANFSLTSGAFADVTVSPKSGSFEVDWALYAVHDGQTGDVYEVTLTGSDGTVIAHKTYTASKYTHSYPNGEDCDDGCSSAELVE